jgi:hypothetical protein
MQVLKDEHDGLGASLLAHEGCDSVEEPEPLAFCIGGERPRQVGAKLTQLGYDLGEVSGACPELCREYAGLRFAYQDAQALDPGPICRSTARFPAATGQHPSIALRGAVQPRLGSWLSTRLARKRSSGPSSMPSSTTNRRPERKRASMSPQLKRSR